MDSLSMSLARNHDDAYRIVTQGMDDVIKWLQANGNHEHRTWDQHLARCRATVDQMEFFMSSSDFTGRTRSRDVPDGEAWRRAFGWLP